MIRFNIYAIGQVGDLLEALQALDRNTDRQADDAAARAYVAYIDAERACQPPVYVEEFTQALRSGRAATIHFEHHGRLKGRSQSSIKAMMDDLTERIIYLANHPEASMIYIPHAGYRLSDPVDECLFRVSKR